MKIAEPKNVKYVAELKISYVRDKTIPQEKITSSKMLDALFRKLFDPDTIEYREEFMFLTLNRANKVTSWYSLSKGGISGTVVDLRIILATALKAGASAIALAHNHPTGEIVPSDMDKSVTRKIKEACKAVELVLLDHVILGEGRYYSFSDEGLL